MENKNALVLLGIVAILVIVGMVLLFKSAMTANMVVPYPGPEYTAKEFPLSLAREYCGLPDPRLDLSLRECARAGWEDCANLHGTTGKVTACQQLCGIEIDNMCNKAHGPTPKGRGMAYTYPEQQGLRRPIER